MLPAKLHKFVERLGHRRYLNLHPVPEFIKAGHVNLMTLQHQQVGTHIQSGDRWAVRDERTWMLASLSGARAVPGQLPVVLLDFGIGNESNTRGWEGTVIINGNPYQGIDRMHREVVLPENFFNDGAILVCYMWSGLADPYQVLGSNYQGLIDVSVDDVYFTLKNILEVADELAESDPLKQYWLQYLDELVRIIDVTAPDDEFLRGVYHVQSLLKAGLPHWPSSHSLIEITAVGHTHIDMAWLWRLSDTREKAYRSFTTVLHLMNLFPSYHFVQSQPQLYEYVQEDHPEIFETIRRRIREGRWEPVGAFWIETDTNMPSGEALIRQILFGTRYFAEQFGQQTFVAWLPDTFGFSAALPQILKRSGINHFVTTKLSWNQTDRMPHDTFYWRGLDGSQVTAHFVTTPSGSDGFSTYNGNLDAKSLVGLWKRYADKSQNDQLLLAFGWGDGGGGPTRDMLENLERLQQIAGAPTVVQDSLKAYLTKLDRRLAQSKDVPVWEGELYLEYHRGTYTSQGMVKWFNRKIERSLHDLEVLWTQNSSSKWETYPTETLRNLWKVLLLHQFHDILPGSAIAPVYEEAHVAYREAMEEANQLLYTGIRQVAEGISGPALLIFNGLLTDRTELVEIPTAIKAWSTVNGRNTPTQLVRTDADTHMLLLVHDIPSGGLCVLYPSQDRDDGDTSSLPLISVRDNQLETPWYHIRWNDRGQLTSWFDKTAHREVLQNGRCANEFEVFEDLPLDFDAWDIDPFYEEKQEIIEDLTHVEIVESGPLRAKIYFRWRYRSSIIEQWLSAYVHTPRVDFVTRVNWHEHHRLLKVAFPVAIHSQRARYAIQFGNIERPTIRNTSWDQAKFEVPGYHWADLAEGDYGVALMNDSKYGYDIHDGVMRLTLIKSATFPDPNADQGLHDMTYSLYPHEGTFVTAHVHEMAERLNSGCHVLQKMDRDTLHADRKVIDTGGYWVEGNHVWFDTLKPLEDGSHGVVIRLYEFGGIRGKVRIHVPVQWKFYRPILLTEETDGEERTIPVDGIILETEPYVIYSFVLRS